MGRVLGPAVSGRCERDGEQEVGSPDEDTSVDGREEARILLAVHDPHEPATATHDRTTAQPVRGNHNIILWILPSTSLAWDRGWHQDEEAQGLSGVLVYSNNLP